MCLNRGFIGNYSAPKTGNVHFLSIIVACDGKPMVSFPEKYRRILNSLLLKSELKSGEQWH